MFRKTIAAILCTVLAAAAFTSCGKELSVDESGNKKSSGTEAATTSPANTNDDTTAAPTQKPTSGSVTNKEVDLSRFTDRSVPDIDTENASVKNFTAPQVGDDIIIMKFQGYDGEVKIRLFPEYAELGVENFVGLANKGYYDGLTFHRVMSDFMIQGGDPQGNGTGGESLWGGKFDGGTSDKLTHAAGALAYANSGATPENSSPTSSDGSQFYIVTGATYDDDYISMLESKGYNYSDDVKKILAAAGGAPWLDGGYTIFGQVYEGLDIIFTIQDVEVYQSNPFSSEVSTPVEPVVLEYVKVGKYEGEELKWFIADYMENGSSDNKDKDNTVPAEDDSQDKEDM